MRMSVLTVNGKRITLQVESLDGIDNVSTSMQDEADIRPWSPRPHSFLKCDFADSKLHVQLRSVTGKRMAFDVQSFNTVANVQTNFEDTGFVPSGPSLEPKNFEEVKVGVVAKTESKKMITVEVVSSDTNDNVKTRIQNAEGTHSGSLGRRLPNCNFVGVRMQISVKTVTGTTVSLEVESFDTFDNVRTWTQGKQAVKACV